MRPARWLTLPVLILAACGPVAPRRGNTVMFASGADLQSINPLFTVHPLAKQVQRYVLLTTLVRYDSAMRIERALARRWSWSGNRLTFTLTSALTWDDGVPTTARDAQWTLTRAADPAMGYPRQADLAGLSRVTAVDDTTLVLEFSQPPGGIPDVLTDLAILPRHLLDTVPPDRLRQAQWQEHPVGNGPFRFLAHEPNRRWVFEARTDYPEELGGPPALDRLVIAVVDEPMTKLAALTSGELDFAGIQPAHAGFVRADPQLVVRDYPLLFTTGIVFNTRRPPFDRLAARRRVDRAVDRAAIVAGFAWGFATAADSPLPPELEAIETDSAPAPSAATAPAPGGGPLEFELLTVGSGEAALEQMLQAQLARQGIRITIRQLELSAFLDRVYGPAPDFTAAVVGVPGDLGLGFLSTWTRLSGMRLPAAELRRRPEAVFRDSLPVAFLYHARGVQGMNRRVTGVELGLRGELASVSRWRVAHE